MSDWMYLQQPPGQGSNTWGGGGQPIRFKDPLDARRSAISAGRVPYAEYPDGYLGTIRSRREDRLMTSVKGRLTQRSYQRGVHKGERIDQSDYMWPPEFHPEIGLEYEARGEKWTARGNPVEVLVNDGKPGAQDMKRLRCQYGVGEPGPVIVQDPNRQKRMSKLLPSWR